MPEQIEAVHNQLQRYSPAQLLGRDACTGEGQFWTIRTWQRCSNATTLSRIAVAPRISNYWRNAILPTSVRASSTSHTAISRSWTSRKSSKKIVDTAQNAPETVILAQDEASLYLQTSLRRVWSPTGHTPVVKSAANRDNTHFYGALNRVSGHAVVLRCDLMKAAATALYLTMVLLVYPDVPILLLWDRAPWHRGLAIRQILAANPRLEILWFPPGCPELNPQEQVWKATREAVSHNHSRPKLSELAEAFETHLTDTRFPCSLLEKHGYQELCAMFK
jgi:transposase